MSISDLEPQREISVDQVRCDLPDFTFVGTVLLDAYLAFQSQDFHQSANRFVVDMIAAVMHLQGDSTVAISTLVFMVNRNDFLFFNPIFIRLLHALEIVVIRTSWHTGNRQQILERVLLP